MRTSDFDYVLPPERIATFPATQRDGARLMCLDRQAGPATHAEFRQITEHLPPAAVIVLNDTRVVPARVRGKKPTGGNTELLLIRRVESGAHNSEELWEAIGRNLRRAVVGTRLLLDGGLVGEVRGHGEAGAIGVSLRPPAGETVMDVLRRVGEVPLPPYIETARKREPAFRSEGPSDPQDAAQLDRERYQTVYAAEPGAVAAPTAGLHFTADLLARLKAAGHRIVFLTLHVGLGTFRPVKVDDPEQHQMDPESYTIPDGTTDAVNEARRSGRPVVAVGTTVVRALESSARAAGDGTVSAGTASSRLFLRPGATFQVVTDLITNFHLPRSTLLMLVSAFAGRERILAAYAEAIAAGYRFYSYGDAMLIRGTP